VEVGMEKVVDVTSARRQFGTILDEVFHKGDIFTIARKGKALAKIVPLEQPKNVESISSQQNNLIKEFNSLPYIGINKDPVEILRSMREQKRIKATTIHHDI
jgi:antitoxin (DNA-binding transcriptional repressor) of toxin-antitoxin stability system